MRMYIVGADERSCFLAELAREKGHLVVDEPPFDVVILPLPRWTAEEEVLAMLPPGQRVVVGQTDGSFEALAQEKGWQLLRVLQDEEFTLLNAIPSAEGAVYAAMRHAPYTLHGANCVVIGYGRIGQVLTRMLRGLGAHVTVVARRQESRDAAGPGSLAIDQIKDALPDVQVLFNTVPSPLIGKEELDLMQESALLIELASAPYGIDLPLAQSMGLRAWLEAGIPARYSPKTAAEIWLSYIERGCET